MTAEAFPKPIDRRAEARRPHTGWSLGQGIASLAIAVGAILMISWSAAGQGAFGIVLMAVGVVALAVVESARVRRRVRWDREHEFADGSNSQQHPPMPPS